MSKTKDSIKAMLRKQWEKVCNGYLVELLRIWELDAHYGYWNSDEVGSIYHYGETHNLTMTMAKTLGCRVTAATPNYG